MTLEEKFKSRPPMFWQPSDVLEITGRTDLTPQQCKSIIDIALRNNNVFKLIAKNIEAEAKKLT
jgi:hypothetical protein